MIAILFISWHRFLYFKVCCFNFTIFRPYFRSINMNPQSFMISDLIKPISVITSCDHEEKPASLSPMCGWQKTETVTSSPRKMSPITPTKRRNVVRAWYQLYFKWYSTTCQWITLHYYHCISEWTWCWHESYQRAATNESSLRQQSNQVRLESFLWPWCQGSQWRFTLLLQSARPQVWRWVFLHFRQGRFHYCIQKATDSLVYMVTKGARDKGVGSCCK